MPAYELPSPEEGPSHKLKDVPVLMLTAVDANFSLGFGSHDIDGDWLPVADFLEKPVDLDVLRSKVAELLPQGGRQSGSPGPMT